MKTETIVMCVVALLLGMLMANMLKSVCGCKTVVEGTWLGKKWGGGEGIGIAKPGMDCGGIYGDCNSWTDTQRLDPASCESQGGCQCYKAPYPANGVTCKLNSWMAAHTPAGGGSTVECDCQPFDNGVHGEQACNDKTTAGRGECGRKCRALGYDNCKPIMNS